MGRKKLSDIEKAQALTKMEHGVSVTKITADLKVSRQAIYKLIKAAKGLSKSTVPKQKIDSGGKQEMSGRKDHLLKQEVLVTSIIVTGLIKVAPRAFGGGFNPDNPKST